MEKKMDSKEILKQFQEDLLQYCNIQIFDDDIKKKDLKGYQKVSEKEKAIFSELFGLLPAEVTGFVQKADMKKAFDEAVKGTYHIVIPEGLHLAKSRTMPGAQKALYLDVGNHSKGPADVIVNEAVLNLSRVPDFVNAAFNLTSFFTGQYFMSQINDKLTDIHHKIDKILGFLEDDKISEIYAAAEELTELTSKLSHVRESSEKIITAVDRVRGLQEVARRNIFFYRRQVEKAFANLREYKKDDYEKIDQKRNEIYSYLNNYELCLNLLCQAKVLEVGILPMSIDEILLYKQDMIKAVSAYTEIIEKSQRTLSKYLDRSFTVRQKKEKVDKGLAVGFSLLFGIITKDVEHTGGLLYDAMKSDQVYKDKREDLLKDNKERLDEKKAMSDFISSYTDKIDNWIAMRSKAIDVVYSDGEYYIKAPLEEPKNKLC